MVIAATTDVTIQECLGKEHHYDDLMAGRLGFIV